MSLQADIRNLASLAPFRDLEPEALRLVALSAETRILRAGDVLFRKGDASDGGLVVLSGTIALENAGKPAVFVKPPTLLGEAALLTETSQRADARARTPASVLKVPRALYRRVLAEYPSSAVRLRQSVAMRLIALQGEYDRLGEAFAR